MIANGETGGWNRTLEVKLLFTTPPARSARLVNGDGAKTQGFIQHEPLVSRKHNEAVHDCLVVLNRITF
jgi:hypothetical protein